jgi:N-carbamoylputrescine amidase
MLVVLRKAEVLSRPCGPRHLTERSSGSLKAGNVDAMRVAILEAQNGMVAGSREWCELASRIGDVSPEVLVTNEMPFGPWLAESNRYDQEAATRSVSDGEAGIEALQALKLSVVLSSRPVQAGERLANEAFALVDGTYQRVHHKQYFPDEPCFYERDWFRPELSGFDAVDLGGWSAGFLLCTELFFTEWARHYRRLGANLIAVPRASGESLRTWLPGAQTAAIVSGCYVASSNRVGAASPQLVFGGRGFCIAPDGSVIAETSAAQPVVVFEIDLEVSAAQQRQYPCYVEELTS